MTKQTKELCYSVIRESTFIGENLKNGPRIIRSGYFDTGYRKPDQTPIQRHVLIMKLADTDLFEYATSISENSIKITEKVFDDVFTTLVDMHSRGFIHRDIKPENILVFNVDSNPKFVLADMGSTRVYIENSPMTPKMGTEGFRSAEMDSQFYTPAVDFFSLGATLVNVLTSKKPKKLSSENLRRLAANYLKERLGNNFKTCRIYKIIKECLQKDPLKRFPGLYSVFNLKLKEPEAPDDVHYNPVESILLKVLSDICPLVGSHEIIQKHARILLKRTYNCFQDKYQMMGPCLAAIVSLLAKFYEPTVIPLEKIRSMFTETYNFTLEDLVQAENFMFGKLGFTLF